MGRRLETREVTKAFGGVRALDRVSFTAEPARINALIGPNGAGKSTLANIISGFTRPDAGSVVVDGVDITHEPAHRRPALGIARTFQNLEVFSGLSVLENVMLGAYGRGRAGFVASLLRLPGTVREEVELCARSLRVLETLGLLPLAHRAVDSLAFGEAKLVELARALALEPQVLLLDEPAAGLAGAEAYHLGERILGLAESGVTVVLIEHNMKLVMEFAHTVTVLDGGRVISAGSPDEVQADRRVIEAYLGPDFESERAARSERA